MSLDICCHESANSGVPRVAGYHIPCAVVQERFEAVRFSVQPEFIPTMFPRGNRMSYGQTDPYESRMYMRRLGSIEYHTGRPTVCPHDRPTQPNAYAWQEHTRHTSSVASASYDVERRSGPGSYNLRGCNVRIIDSTYLTLRVSAWTWPHVFASVQLTPCTRVVFIRANVEAVARRRNYLSMG
ncbi:hypothetical protein CERSUDRAFT_113908 [Gelatoporia subvermispora B]|uniref:Uncharacterized protein n=1 Tax=Ceriporiopsis subvermispora (strain B) TaxID=914234 RepID=M2QYM2_CERS8|nr:hypothetical protein CERSUDRAFT_113908 [Gelatoporia subvermispora B]